MHILHPEEICLSKSKKAIDLSGGEIQRIRTPPPACSLKEQPRAAVLHHFPSPSVIGKGEDDLKVAIMILGLCPLRRCRA